MRKIVLFILSILFLASCQSSAQVEATPVPKTEEPATENMLSTATTPPDSPTGLPAIPPPEMVFPTRKPPEEWQEWPVISEMTKGAYEIYREGIAQGNDSHAFSKVGDCQNIKTAFLGKYGDLTRYPLSAEEENLLDTIENFAGSFDTDGQAVRGGFNAATVLSPLRADPEACLPGESPLVCELRITKPSFVFISFEVWWEGRTVETYEKYMRQIIETVIANHAVPILATKADNVEGDHSLNLATARLATEYDIPLWNFWRAVQPLPTHGMDMERNDGFHTSYEAWDMRSLTALQSLDYLWKNLREETPLPLSESKTPEVEIAVPEALNWDYADNILFDLTCFESNAECPQGIYRLNPRSNEVFPLLEGDYALEAISPNGEYLLLSRESHLLLGRRDEGTLLEITDSLYADGESVTAWVSDETFVALVENEQAVDLAFFSMDGEMIHRVEVDEGIPIAVYAEGANGYLYCDVSDCTSAPECESVETRGWSAEQAQLWQFARRENLPFDTSETKVAYPIVADDGFHDIIFANIAGEILRNYPLPQGRVQNLAWSPEGKFLALTLYVQSSYSGRILKIRNFVIDMENWGLLEYPETFGIAPTLIWSPSGESLLWMGTEEVAETEFRITATCLRGCDEIDFSALNISSPVPLILHQAIWIR